MVNEQIVIGKLAESYLVQDVKYYVTRECIG